jgi:hypothetical protein
MGLFFGNKFSTLLKFNSSINAMFGAVLATVLLFLVCLISVLEKPLLGENQLTPMGLDYFIKSQAVVIAWLFVVAVPEEIHGLFVLIAKAIRTDSDEDDIDVLDNKDVAPGCFRRFLTNLWVPVTLQFWVAGWLIYASGGLANSPYTPILPPMMIIGQSIYPIPLIELGVGAKPSDFILCLGRLVCYYRYPLLMFASLLVTLTLLQESHPLVTKPGPKAETIFTTLLSLFVSMCAVFISRRLDRTAAPGTS